MAKQTIRKHYLNCRRQLEPEAYQCLSLQAQRRLLDSEPFATAQRLALYSPVNNEVATQQLDISARTQQMQVYYPRVAGDTMEFIAAASLNDLVCGTFGVAEPTGKVEAFAAPLDLIVVPGIAFDMKGNRLGYGRGYYDRWLAGKSVETVVVGLCFECQLCKLLPVAGHDQPLDYIVTEEKLISCHL